MIVANTHFKYKDIHKYTREVASRKERSIIDYFLVSKELRSLIKDIKVKRGPEIGSDHFLVVMKWQSKGKQLKEKVKRTILQEKIRCYN